VGDAALTTQRSRDQRERFKRPYNTKMPDDAPLTFEAGLQQLEAIVKEMESGDLPLERALDLFERGTKLSEACRKQLTDAETRVEILMRRAGEMQPQPFRTDK
jgi:exodeoxyribonuclease VII small subunit